MDHSARTAPRRPEVDEDGLAGVEDFALEVGVGYVRQLAGHVVSWSWAAWDLALTIQNEVRVRPGVDRSLRRRRILGTPMAASSTIGAFIFDFPTRRSRKWIGTSSIRKPRAGGAIGHLDLKRVTRARRCESRSIASRTSRRMHLEAAGQVSDRKPQDDARVGGARRGSRSVGTGPQSGYLAALDVARADHDVGVVRGLEQARDVGGIVREVGVHLDDQARPRRPARAESRRCRRDRGPPSRGR